MVFTKKVQVGNDQEMCNQREVPTPKTKVASSFVERTSDGGNGSHNV